METCRAVAGSQLSAEGSDKLPFKYESYEPLWHPPDVGARTRLDAADTFCFFAPSFVVHVEAVDRLPQLLRVSMARTFPYVFRSRVVAKADGSPDVADLLEGAACIAKAIFGGGDPGQSKATPPTNGGDHQADIIDVVNGRPGKPKR